MKRTTALACVLAMALAWGWQRAASTAGARPDEEEAIAVVIHVDALPKFADEGRALLRKYVADTRQADGPIRIEVFEELSRPNHSTLVEVWRGRKVYEDHLGLEHTRAFRAALQPMLGSPFDERLHRGTTP